MRCGLDDGERAGPQQFPEPPVLGLQLGERLRLLGSGREQHGEPFESVGAGAGPAAGGQVGGHHPPAGDGGHDRGASCRLAGLARARPRAATWTCIW